MKRFKVVFAGLLVVCALGMFAFTNKSTVAADTWFEFVGDPDNQASIETPSNYVELDAEPTNSFGTKDLEFIKVEYSTEVYSSGTFVGKPKVNVSGALRTDIRTATDIVAGGINTSEIPNRVLLTVE